MDVTIVIPTKNGGKFLDKVLEKVFSQKTDLEYEVVCVDSGSTDDTVEIIQKYPCKLYEISPQEFGHGKTRNFGASKGSGEFIVFITQDALPATDTWLNQFIEAMRLDPLIAGGFGIHYPYPDCNILDKRDITLHFKGFGDCNTVYYLEDKQRYETEEGYRHFLAFFSDNNSCLRRSVWEQYPYDDVNFAEDQIWARKMIELGYKKVYCTEAPVYHSHNYKLKSYLGRYFDEYRSLYGLHKYVIATTHLRMLYVMFRMIKSDVEYIRGLQLGKSEKIRWMHYAFWREHSRFYGGYWGGHYHEYSKWHQSFLDRHLSQQYKQIRK